MTINIHKEVISDLFQDTKWPMFNAEKAKVLVGSVPKLGAVSFLSEIASDQSGGNMDDVWAELLRSHIYANPRLNNTCSTCLFVAHGGWQPKNRVTLYKGLWKSLPTMQLDKIRHKTEVLFESAEGIRFAGLAEISSDHLLDAMHFLNREISALIVNNRNIDDEQTNRVFHAAFPLHHDVPQTTIDWMSLSTILCPLGDIVIRTGAENNRRAFYMDFFLLSKLLSLLN